MVRGIVVISKIWQRLAWLYTDMSDKEMEKFATQKAKESYILVYESANQTPEVMQSLCMTIGELCFKLADYEGARKFFNAVRLHKSANIMMTRQAEDRVNEVREIMNAQKALNEPIDPKKKKK
jgi:hypothetical protein